MLLRAIALIAQLRRGQAVCSGVMAPVSKPKHAGKAVVAGGISGAVEICCTYPVSSPVLHPRTEVCRSSP